VLRSGQSLLIPVVTDEQIDAAAADPEHADYLRRLGLRSVVIEPLSARGHVLGVLTLIRSDSERAFSEAELPLIRELAVRAATSVDTTRLLHETTEAIRARDEFLAVASHDMRTPLAAILGYLQLALRRLRPGAATADEKLKDYLQAAERMTERLTHLVTDLMDISLLQSGQPLAIDREPVDLCELARRMVEAQGRLITSHEFIYEADGSIVVQADAGRLERVLDNLLSNAVKFSPNGGEIRVAVTADAGQGRLSVADQGLGIPTADLPALFERFRRGSNVGRVSGTGLGLAGSREVVQQMGGDIEVESVEGQGSTFTVVLPLAEAPTPLP
jgi:signal transduction histidine kinase